MRVTIDNPALTRVLRDIAAHEPSVRDGVKKVVERLLWRVCRQELERLKRKEQRREEKERAA